MYIIYFTQFCTIITATSSTVGGGYGGGVVVSSVGVAPTWTVGASAPQNPEDFS